VTLPHIHVTCAIIERDGHVLAARRSAVMSMPLKWEFPGGKIEPGETARDALVRELREELAIEAIPGELLLTHEWVYRNGSQNPEQDGRFHVTYFIVRSFAGEPINHTFEDIRWVTPVTLRDMDILEGNREAVALLLKRSGNDDAESTGTH
jgi:8-oxo-dGTP diphosphatase